MQVGVHMIAHEQLRELVSYDPDTGVFRRLVDSHARWKAGQVTGYIDDKGYCNVSVKGRRYKAHRLAWLYMTGEWPEHEIDHKDGDPSNNRWSNLRDATHAENCRNTKLRVTNTSGMKGVSWAKDKKRWVAQITYQGKNVYLGRYVNFAEAARVYQAAARDLHGDFARP